MDNAEYMRETRKWYKEHGICIRCRVNDVQPGHTRCLQCRFDENEEGRKRRDNWTPEQHEAEKARQRASAKRRYDERRAAGLCTKCGKRPPSHGKTMCPRCLSRNARNNLNYKRKHGALPSDMRGDGLYCSLCCKPVCNGEKTCPSCLVIKQKNVAKARERFLEIQHPWKQSNHNLFDEGE